MNRSAVSFMTAALLLSSGTASADPHVLVFMADGLRPDAVEATPTLGTVTNTDRSDLTGLPMREAEGTVGQGRPERCIRQLERRLAAGYHYPRAHFADTCIDWRATRDAPTALTEPPIASAIPHGFTQTPRTTFQYWSRGRL